MTIDEERPKPAKGLSNLGNTCFYNSTMQCLMHTHSLYDWQTKVTEERQLIIKKGTVVVNEKKVEVPDAVITLKENTSLPLVSALQHFLAEFRVGRNPNPSPLFQQIAVKAPRFRGWAQQDAHELLRYLLDGIRTEELKRYKDAIFTYLGVEDKPTPEQIIMCKALIDSTDRCYIDSIFGGSLLQIISCSKCKHMSNSLEPFLDLSLPLNYGAPSTPTVPTFFPPNNRREGTPSKHKVKKLKKKERREAKKAAKANKTATTVENGNTENGNGEMQSPPTASTDELNPTTTAAIGTTDDIKAIDDNSSTDDDSSNEDMSVSDNENSNPADDAMENGNLSSSSPNYVAVLSPPPPEDDHTEERTVLNSLKHFTAPESLCASNAYECENCCAPYNKQLPANSKDKMTVEATKRYLIYSPPCVLTVHLKRFEQVAMTTFGNRMRTRKIRGHVEFPFVLDISPFCSQNGQRINKGQNEVIYSLYGLVSHSGDLGGGHYVAYVKSRNNVESLKQFMEAGMKPDRLCQTMEELNNGITVTQSVNKEEILQKLDENATWYYASDSHVRTINISEVKNAEAYILFYERIF
uniref:USP domain-containing protein n=1 Tax=Panagrolaimus sp. PS1159 TaxID=55785 RepID=A0AC35FT60_9BILA